MQCSILWAPQNPWPREAHLLALHESPPARVLGGSALPCSCRSSCLTSLPGHPCCGPPGGSSHDTGGIPLELRPPVLPCPRLQRSIPGDAHRLGGWLGAFRG